jgi:agmatine/peptidylarginine deiminase
MPREYRTHSGVRPRRGFVGGHLLLLVFCGGLGWSAHLLTTRGEVAGLPDNVLPAEFEHHQLLLTSWDRLMPTRQWQAISKMIAEASQNIDVIVLVGDQSTQPQAEAMLREHGGNPERVAFLPSMSQRAWVRDFGPFMLRCSLGDVRLLDTAGKNTGGIDDNQVPQQLAQLWGMPLDSLPLVLEGGNLLSNGAGLLITTTATLHWNDAAGIVPRTVDNALRSHFGAQQVVYLEALQGENCEHVDMFCTFTDPSTVVVGRYAPEDDPRNAALLDRNAQKLSGLPTPMGELKVVRIPMPRRKRLSSAGGELWYTYTNVVFVNGKLLVPIYQEVDPAVQQEALAVYQRLLPDWELVGIECDALLKSQGALHCASKHVIRTPGAAARRSPATTPATTD